MTDHCKYLTWQNAKRLMWILAKTAALIESFRRAI